MFFAKKLAKYKQSDSLENYWSVLGLFSSPTQSAFLDFSTFSIIFSKEVGAPRGGNTRTNLSFIPQYNLSRNSPRKIPIRLCLCICLLLSVSEFLFFHSIVLFYQYGRGFPPRCETNLDYNNSYRSRNRCKIWRKQLKLIPGTVPASASRVTVILVGLLTIIIVI